MPPALRLRLLVSDLAGTVVDFGVFGPTMAFRQVFENAGVAVKISDIRKFMGCHKREHLQKLLALPSTQEQWIKVHGARPDAKVESALYDAFVPLQLKVLETESQILRGARDAIQIARLHHMQIGATTGYVKSMASVVRQKLLEQGIRFDSMVASDEVETGRPGPAMIQMNQLLTGVANSNEVVKIGDTPEDILEGKSAGVWTIGILESSNRVGLRQPEFDMLTPVQKLAVLRDARDHLSTARPDFIVNSVAEVPNICNQINYGLMQGRLPSK
jgi:phosphonoacetaldehyde hydrolase